ncbi:MAG: hypothetical protein JXM70_29870 [Pirellulales bacterium]|nr:hypothetical protein [Pirellulales bacterium]
MSTILPIAIFLPLIAALLMGRDRELAPRFALVATIATFAVAMLPTSRFFLNSRTDANTVFDLPWISNSFGAFEVRFTVALDELSVWPFALTCLIMLFVTTTLNRKNDGKEAGYYRLLLIIQTGFLGLFAARDALLFFVFYTSITIPFFFLLGIHGQKRRRTAMRFICLETGGTTAVLLGLLPIAAMTQYAAIAPASVSSGLRLGIFLILVAGFTVRLITPPFVAHIQSNGNIFDTICGFTPAILLSISAVYGAFRFTPLLLTDPSASACPWALGFMTGGAICAGMYCVVLFWVQEGGSA